MFLAFKEVLNPLKPWLVVSANGGLPQCAVSQTLTICGLYGKCRLLCLVDFRHSKNHNWFFLVHGEQPANKAAATAFLPLVRVYEETLEYAACLQCTGQEEASTEVSVRAGVSDSFSPKMAADMLDFGSGIAGRAEVSPFDKGQVTAEAGSCPPPTGVHQLQQQQNDADCCSGYGRLLLSNTAAPAPLLLPSIGGGSGAAPGTRNPLYTPPEHSDTAGALGECSRLVTLPMQSLTFPTESSSPSHTQLTLHAPVVDGNTTLSNTSASGGFCSPTASMRTAASGLKALAPLPAAPGAGKIFG